MSTELNLGDIPDLSGIDGGYSGGSEPLADGWYEGKFIAKREFTDRNGNDRVFESSDTPAQTNGRNIRLQIELTRQSDNKVFNVSTLINYRSEDLTPATVQAVATAAAEVKANGTEWDKSLFRSFMTLTRLGKLQKIAGVRQLQRSADGGLDITPVFGKTGYFRLVPDSRNPQYKEVKDFQANKPVKVPVL